MRIALDLSLNSTSMAVEHNEEHFFITTQAKKQQDINVWNS